ncbi:4-coumarate--CoA ligase [Maridesulfovibrio sp.]|uniref:4-coumarate--CoA ligase n=1 Tax=Maridesulfovibrio sp. TaxID=2795000 RepID=UPI002A18743E|nr:4-coumarate--CoA ligase [Maridesulfovibrio sp.]
MSRPLTLTEEDIRQMISSALLAGMDYARQLDNTRNGILDDSFIPDGKIIPDCEAVLERIAVQFGFEPQTGLAGLSVGRMAEAVFSATEGSPDQLTFFTSGSTGIPSPNASPFADLNQEIRSQAEIYPGRKRIINMVPPHHIYGFLFSILLPKALDIPVTAKFSLPTSGLVESLAPGDLVIAFPLLWNKLGQLPVSFPPDVYGVTSTGPCPADVIKGLRAKGLDRMTEVYGSSETGGVGYRHDPDDCYRLLPHWQKTGQDTLARNHPENAGVTSFTLQDNLEWTGETEFRPIRRTDNAVQVGGINVYPSKVENFFRSFEQVRDCSVRLMRQDEGERLKIFIVPEKVIKAGDLTGGLADGLEADLRRKAAALPVAERPGSYSFGPSLPRSAMGKLADWNSSAKTAQKEDSGQMK